MNEKYLRGYFETYVQPSRKDATYESWVSKIKDNDEYKRGMFETNVLPSKADATYDDWNAKVFGGAPVKKKEPSASTMAGGAKASQKAPAQQPAPSLRGPVGLGQGSRQASPPPPPTSQQGVPSTSRLTSVSGVGDKKPDNFWSFAKTLSENKDKEFVKRMMQPDVSIKNADGTVSTHKMATANIDGKEIAFPTIVNQNGKLVDYSKDINKAIDFALKSNEYISFDDPNKAREFAEGGWKNVIKGYTEKLQKPTIQKPAAKKEETTFVGDLIESVGRGSARLGQMIAETPSFVYDVFAWPQNKLAEITGLPLQASSEEFARTVGLPENEISKYYENQVRLSQEKINQKYDKGITEYFKNGEYSKGLKLLSNQIAESAPITISLAMGNAAGMTTLQSILGGGAVFAAGKKAELDQMPTAVGMSETAKMENAIMTGLFEGVFEQMGITKLGGAVMNMIKGKTAEEAADIAKKSFMEVYGPVLRKYFGTSVEEGLSETGTTFATNVVDKFTGADPNKNLSEGLSDSFLVGLGSGKLFGAGPTLYEISSNRAIRSEAQKIQKQKEQIANALSDPNITKETREVLNESLKEVNLKEAESFSAEKEKIEQLPVDLKQQHDDVVKNINTIEVAMGDPNIPQETVSILENKLKEEYKKAENILAEAERIKAEMPAAPEAVTPTEAAVMPTEVTPEAVAPAEAAPAVVTEGAAPSVPSPEADIKAKKADIERKRQKELDGQYGAGFRLEKRTETTNEQLTDRNVGSIEKAIQQGIQQGKSASEILGILNALGFIPANIGNGTEALRNYLQSRIDGSNITYQQVHANGILTEINAKYDAELAALETAPQAAPATEVTLETAPSVPSPEADIEAKKADIERRRQEELNMPIENFKNAKTKEDLIKAGQEWIGVNPYDGADSPMNVRSALLTTGGFEQGKELFIDFFKKAEEIRAKQINVKYDAELSALETAPATAPTTKAATEAAPQITPETEVTTQAAPSVPSPEAAQTAEVNRQAVRVFEEISPLLDSRKGADVKSKRDINKVISEKIKSNPKADFIYTNWNKLKKQLKFEQEGNCP